MTLPFPVISYDSKFLIARLDVLTAKSLKLEENYDSIMERISSLESRQKCQLEETEHRQQMVRVIELFMNDDVRACTVLDYVIVFFRLILAKLRQRGYDFDDIKQLYKALCDEDVAQTFRTILSKLGFPAGEQKAVQVMLETLHQRPWPTSEVTTTSPGGDAQISSALLFLRLQENLDPDLSSCLQRSLCAAHESVLSHVVLFDVNINASEVGKDDPYAVDGRFDYKDYVDFERRGEGALGGSSASDAPATFSDRDAERNAGEKPREKINRRVHLRHRAAADGATDCGKQCDQGCGKQCGKDCDKEFNEENDHGCDEELAMKLDKGQDEAHYKGEKYSSSGHCLGEKSRQGSSVLETKNSTHYGLARDTNNSEIEAQELDILKTDVTQSNKQTDITGVERSQEPEDLKKLNITGGEDVLRLAPSNKSLYTICFDAGTSSLDHETGENGDEENL